MNSQQGDFFDVIFEMPSKDRGIVTFNCCPVVDECEANGRTDELLEICMKTCPPAITNTAALYNADIDLKALAMPPRKSKDHICCKFEVCYKSGAAKGKQESEEVDLKIDRNKKDIRGDLTVDPNVELKDYSGPFKPDLRITDFSREQLARMYLNANQYDVGIMNAYNFWVGEKFGFDCTVDMNVAIWGSVVIGDSRKLHMRFMNIAGNDIASFMKAVPLDVTSLPPDFEIRFEMPSEDRGIMTFNKCLCCTMMEPQGRIEDMLGLCAMDLPAIGNSARMYHPDMRVKILAFPPRENDDEICCKWELYYDATKPAVTWFDGKVWDDPEK